MNDTGKHLVTQSSWNATPAPLPEAVQEAPNPQGNWSEPIVAGVRSVQGLSEFEQAQQYLDRIASPLIKAGMYVSVHHPSEWMGTNKETGKPELQEGVPGYAFNNIGEALNTAFWIVNNKKLTKQAFRNVYLAMSGQIKPKGTFFGKLPIAHRVRPNVGAAHGLWIDIDVKPDNPKAYPSTGEADRAIFQFLKQSGMPFPNIVVNSGTGGKHLYWILERLVEPDEWKPLALGLANATIRLGLKCDTQCTADIIRLLRVPGTFNFKTDPSLPVTLMYDDNQVYYFEDIQRVLEQFKGARSAATSLTLKRSGGVDAHGLPLDENEDLTGGMGCKGEFPPVDIKEVAKYCPYIRHTLDTGGADLVGNEQWFLTTALAQYCVDPLQTAKLLCLRNPFATPEGVEEQLTQCQQQRANRETIGPPKCARIALQMPQCKTCPHLDLGTTPLNVAALRANTPAQPIVTKAGVVVSPLGGKGVYGRLHDYFLSSHIFAYDEFARKIYIDRRDWDEETAIQLLNEYISKHPHQTNEPSLKQVEQAVFSLSHANKFNSVVDYLRRLKWDGVPRIDTWLLKYCGAKDTVLNRSISRKSMISFVMRPLRPGCKLDTMLTLEGKQGRGKSSVFFALADAEHHPERFYDGPIIHESGKEQLTLLQGCWFAEIAELSDFRKGDINKVNSYLSRRNDKTRVLFTNIPVSALRCGVTVGTTNDRQYLLNAENRRFWCVVVSRILLEEIAQDRDQLFAEAVAAFDAGESAVLPETMWADAAKMQQKRRIADDWEDVLAAKLTWPEVVFSMKGVQVPWKPIITEIIYKGRKVLFAASTDITIERLELQARDLRGQTGHRLAKVMQQIGWRRKRIKGIGRGYIRELPGDASLAGDEWDDEEDEDITQ